MNERVKIMFVCSKNSRRRVVHYPTCRYASGLKPKQKKYFYTLQEARLAGYRLCNCCAPISKYLKGNRREIQEYCRQHELLCSLHDGGLTIATPYSQWKIITGNRHHIFLYHKSTAQLTGEGPVPGYHPQKVHRDNIMDYLRYITAHDEFRLNFARSSASKKGSRRRRKQQKKARKYARKMQIQRVLSLIDRLQAANS